MEINVDRGSVAAGDDVDAHLTVFDLPDDVSLAEAVARIVGSRFLASIMGGKATWVLEGGQPLAVVAQEWSEPRWLVDASLPVRAYGSSLFFRYLAQRDPAQVWRDLAGQG